MSLVKIFSFSLNTPHQVKAAVSALSNTRGLNWPASFEQQRQKTGELDVLDWLRAMFGFQVTVSTSKNEIIIA